MQLRFYMAYFIDGILVLISKLLPEFEFESLNEIVRKGNFCPEYFKN